MFFRKKETQAFIVHVAVDQLPVSQANALVKETVAAFRKHLGLKHDVKVFGVADRHSHTFIESLYIDSNLIGE